MKNGDIRPVSPLFPSSLAPSGKGKGKKGRKWTLLGAIPYL